MDIPDVKRCFVCVCVCVTVIFVFVFYAYETQFLSVSVERTLRLEFTKFQWK